VPAQDGAKRMICEKLFPRLQSGFSLRDLVADMASGKSILVLMHSQYRVGPPRSPQMEN
jgi:hypothetical protein